MLISLICEIIFTDCICFKILHTVCTPM